MEHPRPRLVLVTGAGGKTGRAICHALAARRIPVRAFIYRPELRQPLLDLGVSEALVGDLLASEEVRKAASGVDVVYHICPNVHPAELEIGRIVIEAAETGGVRRIVYHSVLHPQTEEMRHHWNKLRVEGELFRHPTLAYTILQPTTYMQNILPMWEAIRTSGIYHVPYGLKTRLGMVDLVDVARAAVLVVMEPGHEGATYELSGGEVLNPGEVAAILSRALGRPVRAETVSREVWKREAERSGRGSYHIRTLIQMFEYYERYGFGGNPNVLAWLLGRPPTSFASFVDRIAHTDPWSF